MKFPKLHLVCADDNLRPVMMHVCIGKEYTFASNAHILIRHKTSELFDKEFINSLPDEDILVPRKAIFLTCQKQTEKISLSDDKTMFVLRRKDESIISFKLFKDNKYPDANSVIPDLKNMKPIEKIGINSSFLLTLTNALGSDLPIIKMFFFDNTKSICIESNYSSEYPSAIGVIMPVMTHDHEAV